jgi:FkbM family methyltransferase
MSAERLKYLLRSHSLRFTRDHYAEYRPGSTACYTWNAQRVWYRPGTSDTELIYKILLKGGAKGEYAIEPAIRAALGAVHTIVDVGANIGISSLYLARAFPQARLFAFEPVPSNFALLERNVAPLGRVQCRSVALGEHDGSIDILHSDNGSNFGGFSRFEAGSNKSHSLAVPIRHAKRQFEELGISAVDVMKIDVEGSEWEVLTALGANFLRRVKFMIGELHGRRDFELLGILSEHFHISVRKNLGDRCFMFRALNRSHECQ